jgi:uncharacterized protein YceH (UPF0502 family)
MFTSEGAGMKFISHVAVAALFAAVLSVPAAAQTTVSQAEISRLQDNVYLAERDVQQLRGRDSTRAGQLQAEIDELRDEVIYLKVKLRKERSLARTEYADVRDRIEDVRTRARDDAPGRYSIGPNPPSALPAPAPAPAPVSPAPSTAGRSPSNAPSTRTASGQLEVPVGTELDVRLSNTLNSGTAQVEDRFEGTALADLLVDNRLAIPAGAVLRGVVTSVERGTRTNRTSRLAVSFDQVTINGRSYPLRATVTQALEGEGIRGEAGRTAAGAGVGAIIGGILGGFKGALAGLIIGGGGTIAATEGKEVELLQGSVLRIRVDSPLLISSPPSQR